MKSLEHAVLVPAVQALIGGIFTYALLRVAQHPQSDLLAAGYVVAHYSLSSFIYTLRAGVQYDNKTVPIMHTNPQKIAQNRGLQSQQVVYDLKAEEQGLEPKKTPTLPPGRHEIILGHQIIYLNLPPSITPAHLIQFYKVVVRDGQPPTERNLCRGAGLFSNGNEGTLTALRDVLVRRNLAVWKGGETRMGWQLTPRGVRAITQVYQNLKNT